MEDMTFNSLKNHPATNNNSIPKNFQKIKALKSNIDFKSEKKPSTNKMSFVEAPLII